jgi:pimeloyl-ACP methyl ester carboxylesterase
MADAIPGASLVVIRSAGHLPTLERPSETTDAIVAFLAGLP